MKQKKISAVCSVISPHRPCQAVNKSESYTLTFYSTFYLIVGSVNNPSLLNHSLSLPSSSCTSSRVVPRLTQWSNCYCFRFGVQRVRLDRAGGAWCPRQQATHQPRDWLEINLKTDHVITAVESQVPVISMNNGIPVIIQLLGLVAVVWFCLYWVEWCGNWS